MTHLKTSIQRKKNEFETIKISAEAGKAVFSLIEILKYDKSFGENKSLIEENKIYCVEFTKLLFLNEKGQEFLKTLKFASMNDTSFIVIIFSYVNNLFSITQTSFNV